MLIILLLLYFNPLVSSFSIPTSKTSTNPADILRRTDGIPPFENAYCGSFFGTPYPRACSTALRLIQDANGVFTSVEEENTWKNEMLTFLGLGVQVNPGANPRQLSTPLFFQAGTCIIAAFVSGGRQGAIEQATWPDIWQGADYVNQGCVHGPNHWGGRTFGIGIDDQISIYVYEIGSRMDNLLITKLTCPKCGDLGCSGAPNLGNQCSNNPKVTKNAAPAQDPENPSSLPGTASTISINIETVCGNPCNSQADCTCGDYLCLEDQSLSRQMNKLVQGCIYVIGSSFTWGRVSGNVPKEKKRDAMSVGPAVDLSTCACNATYTGETCCYAPGGLVYLD